MVYIYIYIILAIRANMSIVTLKKKTQYKYNNNSVGYAQFSINGTRRSQGYVGQTSLSRSLPRTIMRGNVICGNGGCCGTYKVTPIVLSGIYNLNDDKVTKSSVVGTTGMLTTKYRWIRRPPPYSAVKSSNMNNLISQSIYIANKARVELNNFNLCDKVNYVNGIHINNTHCIANRATINECANNNGFKNRNYNVANSSSRRILETTKSQPVQKSSENITNISYLCVKNDLILPVDPNLTRTPLI